MTTTGPLHQPQHNRREDRVTIAVIAVVCGLGFAGAVSPTIEHAATVALLTLAALAVVVLTLRWVGRLRRERAEDRADALAAIAWRAAHLPADHPLVLRDQATTAAVRASTGALDGAGMS